MENNWTKPVTVTVNGKRYDVQPGKTILETCAGLGYAIPTLCHLPEVVSNASCGICIVEVKGAKSLIRSCVTPISEGMGIPARHRRGSGGRR
jgi:NADH dehydrogenase/NADH:ubiquinone oxidoreductase subunit G